MYQRQRKRGPGSLWYNTGTYPRVRSRSLGTEDYLTRSVNKTLLPYRRIFEKPSNPRKWRHARWRDRCVALSGKFHNFWDDWHAGYCFDRYSVKDTAKFEKRIGVGSLRVMRKMIIVAAI